MQQFFIQPENITKDTIILKGQEYKHAFVVRRLKKGDEILVFDGSGKCYVGIVKSITAKHGLVQIKKTINRPENKLEITLAQALPKKRKFDEIVDKATQLGVLTIIPIITQRTILKIPPQKAEAKIERWRKIAIEAAKQSGQPIVPKIEKIHKFKTLIKQMLDYDLKLIASCEKNAKPLRKVIRGRTPNKVIIFIGPEGDFTLDELTTAKKNGCIDVSLGQNILRCETAAANLLSIINYEWNN